MKKILSLIVAGLFLICSLVHAREIVDLLPGHPGVLFCWTETYSSPRPFKAHFLMIDLTSEALEIIAVPGDDPDSNGPAESQLTDPAVLFNKSGAIAAVNANAFAAIGKEKTNTPAWYEGQPVDIMGLVVSRGKTVSPVEKNRTSFWLDRNRKPHIGEPANASAVTEAVAAWFSPLVINGKVIPDTSDPEMHPRTALGFDESGKWLLVIVVDGRQPGYSEGVTLYELGIIMKERGCTQSINLDGGGSSVMMIRDKDDKVKLFNRPSGGDIRPVPVILGVRKR